VFIQHTSASLTVNENADPTVRRDFEMYFSKTVPENDPDFGESGEELARHWCERAGIPYLGRADIGHDADNKVVPFGFA